VIETTELLSLFSLDAFGRIWKLTDFDIFGLCRRGVCQKIVEIVGFRILPKKVKMAKTVLCGL
jgi:hypothetical protein